MELYEPISIEDAVSERLRLSCEFRLQEATLLYFIKSGGLYLREPHRFATFLLFIAAYRHVWGNITDRTALQRARAGAIVVRLHKTHGYPLDGECTRNTFTDYAPCQGPCLGSHRMDHVCILCRDMPQSSQHMLLGRLHEQHIQQQLKPMARWHRHGHQTTGAHQSFTSNEAGWRHCRLQEGLIKPLAMQHNARLAATTAARSSTRFLLRVDHCL